MKFQEIRIVGVGGITDLTIQFDPSMNIICGPNGIGKTTILESIAHCFSLGGTSILKRNANSTQSQILAKFENNNNPHNIDLRFSTFEPNQQADISGQYKLSKYLLSLKTTRTFNYQPLNSIGRDPTKENSTLWNEAKNGVPLQDIKNWFVNRYLYSAHPGALNEHQVANLQLAKECFSALNSQFKFSRVNASTNEIIISTPSGEIYHEYLSSGFKSCLSILFGIIKEIEFRFSGPDIQAKSFNGVILIDELELHLHPEWQAKIQGILTKIFPNAQFITTTHSPHVIQAADINQIIALEISNGLPCLRPLPNTKHGFKGWTVDEVLTDVMGMTDTRSDLFISLIEDFGKAIDREDYETAKSLYNELDTSLHPNNTTRKLLKIQLASIAGNDNDQTQP